MRLVGKFKLEDWCLDDIEVIDRGRSRSVKAFLADMFRELLTRAENRICPKLSVHKIKDQDILFRLALNESYSTHLEFPLSELLIHQIEGDWLKKEDAHKVVKALRGMADLIEEREGARSKEPGYEPGGLDA